MSVTERPSSQHPALEAAFGAPVHQLYATATGPGASAALRRALELRSFLVVAEEQVAWVRDRVHAATDPGLHQDTLSADVLRREAEWLQAAVEARAGYRTALDSLLRAMPQPGPAAEVKKVQFNQPRIIMALPPAAPAPARSDEATAGRP
ncbi:hypothetical protein ACIBCM_32225 [Streptomyces sp. NPDC051018]|uniref:hypothetical protein n=1 Tax=Streptomyces sp. NPDC051018 TaxID=3365639 RepID=UPI0037B16481